MMFTTTTYGAGTMIGTRSYIDHVELIRIIQSHVRVFGKPTVIQKVGDYRFLCFRTPDLWSVDLMVMAYAS